jgi:hypothetical protein
MKSKMLLFCEFAALLVLAQTYTMLAVLWFATDTIVMFNSMHGERYAEIIIFLSIAAASVFLAAKKLCESRTEMIKHE